VAAAAISDQDLVFDLGAGTGVLTQVLAGIAARVVAIEVDPGLAAGLRRRTAALGNVEVVTDDVLLVPFPARPFKVVANPPFHVSSALLRRLAGAPGLARADLVLSWGQAIGLTQVHPASLPSVAMQPWFELVLLRRIPAAWFSPAPSVDAGVVSLRRRVTPMLPADEADGFRRFLGNGGVAGLDVWAWVDRYRRTQPRHARRSRG
jgi:23S rRNA (adenine-N6)-dimethyltransferase